MWLYLTLAGGAALLAVYFINLLTLGITRSSTCLVGKTAVITGANSGLGYQTALNLASRGCRVIMADVADMEESKANIIKYTNNPNIVTKKLDLSSLKSVRDFAADINKSEERLNILLNNAGIVGSLQNRTDDGLQPAMQINYFGHFLLTHLLIDLLKKSAPSRIVHASSLLAFANNLDCHNLNFNADKSSLSEFFRQWAIYGNSKLAVIVASDIFGEKLKGTGVTSNCIHPGLVSTPIFNTSYSVITNKGYHLISKVWLKLVSKNPWEGSQTLVHTAVSRKLQNVTGKFFVDCKPFFKPLSAYNKAWCQEIWKASENYVGLKPSEKL